MDGLIIPIIIFVVALFFVLKYRKKEQKKVDWSALPKEGPMQVKLVEEDIPAGTFDSKQFKCALKIQVRMSQADWKAIAQMGLMDHIILNSPGFDESRPHNYTVRDMQRWTNISTQKSGVRFNNVVQMQEAKAQLVQNLQNLRSQIEARSSGPKSDTIEI